jgi:hypothetical protein
MGEGEGHRDDQSCHHLDWILYPRHFRGEVARAGMVDLVVGAGNLGDVGEPNLVVVDGEYDV